MCLTAEFTCKHKVMTFYKGVRLDTENANAKGCTFAFPRDPAAEALEKHVGRFLIQSRHPVGAFDDP